MGYFEGYQKKITPMWSEHIQREMQADISIKKPKITGRCVSLDAHDIMGKNVHQQFL